MPKGLKLERVTGVVALSYLVLIPVAGYVGYRKLQDLDNDITTLWEGTPEQILTKRVPIFSLRNRFRTQVIQPD